MIIFKINLFQDEVPSALMDAHVKNIEAATTDGKYDPAVGLLQVMIKYNSRYIIKVYNIFAVV